jgi:hypothetical protein
MPPDDSIPLLVKVRQWLRKPMSPEEEEAYRRDLRERAGTAVAAAKARVQTEALEAAPGDGRKGG